MSQAGIILLVETIAITMIGSLLHFTYQWAGEKKLVGIFAAVNESTWEHIKLALSGIFCCTLVDVWFVGDNPNYWLAKSISFLVPIIVIPIIFYSYTSFTTRAVLPVDIASFAVTAFLSALAFVWVLDLPAVGMVGEIISMILSLVIIAAYLLLTLFPIRHNLLFEDPVTHKYGFAAYRPLKMFKKKSKK